MKRFILLAILFVMASLLAFALSYSFDYKAKVVNVSSSLNIRERGNTKSAVVGKLQNGDVVSCSQPVDEIKSRNSWVMIQYGSVTGYVKASYLEKYIDAPVSESYVAQTESNGFFKKSHYYILLGFSILIFILSAQNDHSIQVVLTMLASLIIVAVLVLTYEPGRELQVFDDGGAYWGRRLINMIIVGVTMCALVIGYLSTCYGLADMSTDSYEDYNRVSVSFFLWLTPLAFVCLYFPIALIVVLPLALWKFGLNCKLMWPKVHITIIILFLGVLTCLLLVKLFVSILTQLIIGIVFGFLIMGFLKGSASSLSSRSYSGDSNDSCESGDRDEQLDMEIVDEHGYVRKLKDEGFGRMKDDEGNYWRTKGTFTSEVEREE